MIHAREAGMDQRLVRVSITLTNLCRKMKQGVVAASIGCDS